MLRIALKVLLGISLLLCANQNAAAKTANFLCISDTHLDPNAGEVTYGEDTGAPLWNRFTTKIASTIQAENPTFILLLGDLPAHEASTQERATDDRQVLKDLRKIADPEHIPLFYIPGNNDSIGGDYYSFTGSAGLTPLILDAQGRWPGANSRSDCKHSPNQACILDKPYKLQFGYYSAYPLGSKQKLRLIALNTVIFSNSTKHPYVGQDGVSQEKAATQEIDWLKVQLLAADQAHEQVYIAMHIPPGLDAYGSTNMWKSISYQGTTIQNAFLDLMNQYQGIVKGLFTGHTHMDEIRKLANRDGELTVVALSIPGVTPEHGNNPGFKSFIYSSDDYTLLDSTTFYTTPMQSDWGNTTYSFAQDYGCQSRAIKACIAALPESNLAIDMNVDYAVKNPAYSSDWDSIDAAIDVNYQGAS